MTYGESACDAAAQPFPAGDLEALLRRDPSRLSVIILAVTSWFLLPIALLFMRWHLDLWGKKTEFVVSFGWLLWLLSFIIPGLTLLLPSFPHRHVPLSVVLVPLLFAEGAFSVCVLTQSDSDYSKLYSPFVEASSDPDGLTSLIVDISVAVGLFALVAYCIAIVFSLADRSRAYAE